MGCSPHALCQSPTDITQLHLKLFYHCENRPLLSFLLKLFRNLLHLWLLPGNSTDQHLFGRLCCSLAKKQLWRLSAIQHPIKILEYIINFRTNLQTEAIANPLIFLSAGLGFQEDDPHEVDDLLVIPSCFQAGQVLVNNKPHTRCTCTQLLLASPPARSYSSKSWTHLTSLGWWDPNPETNGCRPVSKQISARDTTHWSFIPIYYLSNTCSRSICYREPCTIFFINKVCLRITA